VILLDRLLESHHAVLRIGIFVVAVVAGFLGFTGIAGATFGIAKILFFVFLAACIITFIFGRRNIL
jgi:uncharacterized membrane protein YtjA (UPF0391 family)